MYVDLKDLYSSTDDGYNIFQYYFNDSKLKDPKYKFKIRTSEKTESAQLSYFKNLWRITDFGNQGVINGMSPVDFVMYREGLQFADAVKFINEIILGGKLHSNKFERTVNKPEYSSREFNPDTDKIGEYNFTFKKQPLPDDLKTIGRYVTKELLAKYDCKVVERYEYSKFDENKKKNIVHIYASTLSYPIYLFDYGDFKKLYRPKEEEKQFRFLYIGQKPTNHIFGLKQILRAEPEFKNEDTDEEIDELDALDQDGDVPEDELEIDISKTKRIVKDVFRCSGESDALNLASLGFHVYWLNSESAEFDWRQFQEIDQYSENHYQIMDLDSTGILEAQKNALKHIDMYTILLPEWVTKYKDWRGNRCKDLKDFINLSGKTKDETERDFRVIKTNARRAKFWEKSKKPDKDGKRAISFSMENLYFFLRLNGFYRINKTYVRKHDYMYVKIDNGKTVRLISPDKIKMEVKSFTKKWIENRKLMSIIPLLNKINTSNQIIDTNLQELPLIELNFRNASKGIEWLHFNNGMSMRITPDEIKMVNQREIPNYILGELRVNNNLISHIIPQPNIRVLTPPIEVFATEQYQALLQLLKESKTEDEKIAIHKQIDAIQEIDRYTVKINDKDFYFIKFLKDLSRLHWRKEIEQELKLTEEEIKEENLTLANLLFTYGFLASEYKDKGRSFVVVTMDNKISEVGLASGRSGKSLKTDALKRVRPLFYIGGKALDNPDGFKFIYDGFTEFHNIIEVDDFAEFGIFDRFYTEITGTREINPKNYSGVKLDYEESGKMVLSTNYEIQNNHPSSAARTLYEVVSDYYHEKTQKNDYLETRKPDLKFGRFLYDDFTPEEWNKFYNIIAYCIQLQMRFYKINPPMGNIFKRELRRDMQRGVGKTDDFFKWANNYFTNKPEEWASDYSVDNSGYVDCYIIKENAWNDFTSILSTKQKSDYRIQKFKDNIALWCDYWGFGFNPKNLCNNNDRIIKKIDGKAVECIYIASNGKKLNQEENVIDDEEFDNSDLKSGADLPF